MILYYGINYTGGGVRHASSLASPYWAFAYLAVSAALWIWLLARSFRKWLILPAAAQRQLNELLRTGTVRDAEVVACNNAGKQVSGGARLDVTFRFNNLSGVPIRETLRVEDRHPERGRFNTGRLARIRIDKTLTKSPVVAIDGAEFQANQTQRIAAFLGWLLLAAVVAGFYIFSYRYEHQGTGWRFLALYHPLVICPLALLGVQWLFSGGLASLFTGQQDTVRLKYSGYRTEARLLEAKQTGTYINEQPQVRFELEYEDLHGA
ncbi:MAG TPA: hypothetical protein VNQ55_00585, partial [Parapedobacter sp.]|nr:hypothetical protein [Parapedobacter sp.]